MTTAQPSADELTTDIRSEIRSLRKGRGLPAADLTPPRIPHLRELAAGPAVTAAPDRQAIAREINSYAARLPLDLRTALSAGLGLMPETSHLPQLTNRILWLSERIDRSYRVALRRVDLAEHLLAEEVARELRRRRSRIASTPSGWYLSELRTVFRLDTPTPEAYEHRRIVATRDGINEVMAWLDLPRSADRFRSRLDGEMLYGGRLVRREQPSHSRFQFLIQLPVPLRVEEAHEYGLLLRVPEGEPIRPHYVFTPECHCREFTLRVRFPLDRPPRWVRRVEAETVRTFDIPQPGTGLLAPDATGEVRTQFPNPTMYLGYGLQWGW